MTKVEELGIRVLNEVIHVDRLLSQAGAEYEVNLVQTLISAAHAEGVAEGAERGVRKERRRLKATRERYVEGVRFINDVGYYLIPLRAFRVPPASVLAPTRESEK